MYQPKNPPQKGEVQLKVWIAEQAEKHAMSYTGIWARVFRGHTMPMPEMRRVNARVIYVRPN